MERWQQIESLFQEALQRPAAERDAFLRQASGGDADLLREVQSLLANHREGSNTEPWAATAAAQLIAAPDSLQPGQTLGPYQIVSFIAAGGMGSVYRARDPRMGREVAIKVAAERFSERFSREVRAVAALNHPNICHVYDVGPNYLVMELVEGESPKGPLPLEEALRIARQIADALEEAHEKGIVHRDLKPGNIKVRPDGTVKVLDFGLAKATSAPAAHGPEDSPTISMAATQAGVILGTAAYMSPEQARGKPVDKRADIWAFGVVLYEMLTGKRLFQGEDLTETLASVVKEEPRLDQAPAKVHRLLRKCLEKDPRRRLRDIGDVWELLEDAPETAPARPRRGIVGWIAAAALAAIAGVALWAPWRTPPAAPDVKRYQIPMKVSAAGAPFMEFAVSPDGRNLAYLTREVNVRRLWIHSLDSLEARAVPAAEVADENGAPVYPFWSPDGQYVAFVSGTKLRKVNISNGSAQTICDVTRRLSTSGSWSRDGVILVGNEGEISRVSDAGGTPSPVVAAHGAKEGLGFFPDFLPDGRHFLYYGARIEAEGGAVYIGSLDLKPDAQNAKPLLSADSAAIFAADPSQPSGSGLGHIVFQREGTLFSQPFNAKRLQLTGEAVLVADQVGHFVNLPSYSVSTNGVLIYHSGVLFGFDSQLTWFDRQGHATGTLGEPSAYYGLARISPDGTRVAFTISPKSTNDLWVFDIGSGRRTRLTIGGQSSSAVWSPDGSRIVFARLDGKLFRKNADGTGDEEALFTTVHPALSSWSRDGRYLLYSVPSGASSSDIWVLPLEGDSKPFPFLSTPAAQRNAVFSPDGRWVAYNSNETGEAEIYVRPFPPSNRGKWLVSNGASGRGTPSWRRDGRELYYMAPDRSVMAVPVTADSVFQHGEPKALFKLPPTGGLSDVMPDGNRFLAYLQTNVTQPSSPPFTVVLNWQAGLKK
ncbi:Serine/threonine protein kinase [Candidatus Sulfopaludibacter sp. SbA6]|nr:Serine/threonine protein kinase [Candidatus Sulfopaludibacter sp. SbA6]